MTMTTPTLRLGVLGVGVWTPGFANFAAWAARAATGPSSDALAQAPAASLLPPMLRRRCSLLTRMAAEVASQAVTAANLVPADVSFLHATVYGEIATTVELLAALQDPTGPLSPTRFHNSVHNTAAGYVSIATRNHGGNAALTAGPATVAMGLLECAGIVAATGGPAVLVIAEESLPAPLTCEPPYAPLAVAVAVTAAGTGRTLQLHYGPLPSHAEASAVPAAWAANPCARALDVADALAQPHATAVALHADREHHGWWLDIAAEDRAS